METVKLSSEQIAQQLQAVDNWRLDLAGQSITNEWKFETFRSAIHFLVKVADVAEIQNHHPDFYSSYKRVKIKLTTHDAGGLTDKDFVLAAEIDRIASNHPCEK